MMQDLINTYLGQYLVTELIRAGETANIYKAYQPALDRFVAIKVISSSLPDFGSDFATQFKLAAQEIAKIHHPNILRIYYRNEQDGLCYLVLQYIEGGSTLANMLGKPLAPTTVIPLVNSLLDALNFAHQSGVIHGDIKPPNVLLTSSGWPLLTDFGIVKRVNTSQRLLTGKIIGSPAYMVPEVIGGGEADGRTDIYALGIVLYEMLTGHVPFDDPDPMKLLHQHVYAPLASPRLFVPELPAPLETVLQRALAKKPEERYQTAAEMAAELTRVAEKLPQDNTQGEITALYHSGVQAFAAGRWEVAVEQFSQILAHDPLHEEALEMLTTARDAQDRARRAAQEHLASVRERQSELSQKAQTTPKTVELAPISERPTARIEHISGFSVAGVAGDGETVVPPAGTAVTDWNIFVSPNNALLESNIRGILCTAAENKDENVWIITMKLRGSGSEWHGGVDKKANFLLVRA
jgi:serine/threonine protein kinase